MKVSRGVGVLLVGLLVLSVAPRVRAQQRPPGCSGTGLTLNLFVARADGSDAGAGTAVSPCETLIYKGSLTGGSPPACCFQGGTVTITTARTCASAADCTECVSTTTCATDADCPAGDTCTGASAAVRGFCFVGGTLDCTPVTGTCGTETTGRCSYDVTPPGGVPEKCPGAPVTTSLAVQYQVREQDIVFPATCPAGTPPGTTCGKVTARIDYTAAESFTGTPPSTGVPIGSTSVPNTVVPCPHSTRCVTAFCDPNLQGTGADLGRKGLCKTVAKRRC